MRLNHMPANVLTTQKTADAHNAYENPNELAIGFSTAKFKAEPIRLNDKQIANAVANCLMIRENDIRKVEKKYF